LIQTPEGVGEVQLLINEISIQLGSTVFFQAQANRQMTVSTLEGHADVRAFGLEQTAYAGTQVSIPLDDNLRPAGPPSPPQPYETARMQNLPTRLLQRQITLAPPMTPLEIQTRLTEEQSITSTEPEDGSDEVGIGDDNTSDDGNTGEQIQDCPGQSCNAPGQGGSCPGNSCNAPGQNKDDKDTGKKDK
ncbi:MAG: hypothetical protein K8L99_00970, partial [Anaerolineae bacterium]|nr:hypothetical protein [Anaerolineae bacterium]